MIFRYFKRGDTTLIAVLLVLSTVSLASVHHYGFNGRHAVVEVNGHRVLELSLDRDVTTTVNGPLGETVIIVEDRTVRIADSPCPHHYCVRMGRLRHRGEIAVCVLNNIVLTISGGNDHNSYDGVTQ